MRASHRLRDVETPCKSKTSGGTCLFYIGDFSCKSAKPLEHSFCRMKAEPKLHGGRGEDCWSAARFQRDIISAGDARQHALHASLSARHRFPAHASGVMIYVREAAYCGMGMIMHCSTTARCACPCTGERVSISAAIRTARCTGKEIFPYPRGTPRCRAGWWRSGSLSLQKCVAPLLPPAVIWIHTETEWGDFLAVRIPPTHRDTCPHIPHIILNRGPCPLGTAAVNP